MNLLLVTLDQFRGECLSVAGHRVARTPNLDRLANSGVRFAATTAKPRPAPRDGHACTQAPTR